MDLRISKHLKILREKKKSRKFRKPLAFFEKKVILEFSLCELKKKNKLYIKAYFYLISNLIKLQDLIIVQARKFLKIDKHGRCNKAVQVGIFLKLIRQ